MKRGADTMFRKLFALLWVVQLHILRACAQTAIRPILVLLLCAVVIQVSQAQQQNPLTNADIVKLVKAGISDHVIADKIKSSETDFDTSPDTLVKLKQIGVSDALLTAMLEAQHPKRATVLETNNAQSENLNPLRGILVEQRVLSVAEARDVYGAASTQNDVSALVVTAVGAGTPAARAGILKDDLLSAIFVSGEADVNLATVKSPQDFERRKNMCRSDCVVQVDHAHAGRVMGFLLVGDIGTNFELGSEKDCQFYRDKKTGQKFLVYGTGTSSLFSRAGVSGLQGVSVEKIVLTPHEANERFRLKINADLPFVRVVQLEPKSAAAAAGLRIGDVVRSVILADADLPRFVKTEEEFYRLVPYCIPDCLIQVTHPVGVLDPRQQGLLGMGKLGGGFELVDYSPDMADSAVYATTHTTANMQSSGINKIYFYMLAGEITVSQTQPQWSHKQGSQ